MAGFWPEIIEIDKNKKPKDTSWKACLKLMKNPDDFMKRLGDHKDIIDANLVPVGNMKFVKDNYCSKEDFTPQAMAAKSGAARGLCDWVINMVTYWEVI
jgi:dynein heavy chain